MKKKKNVPFPLRIDSVFAIRKAEAQKGATQHCVFGDFSIFIGFDKVNPQVVTGKDVI